VFADEAAGKRSGVEREPQELVTALVNGVDEPSA
jgi:hypothetical protein